MTIRKSKCICLTFDDGPHPISTPKILRVLKENGVKATFFLLGENIEKYPELVNKIISEGHEIGEHSYNHSHPWKSDPFRSAFDLVKGGRTLKHFTKSQNYIFFRPPYGKFNLVTLLYILLTNKKAIFWDIDPKDYASFSGGEVAEFVLGQLASGSVVLLHDGRRNKIGNNINVTLSALKQIIESSENNQYSFVTISEALSKP